MAVPGVDRLSRPDLLALQERKLRALGERLMSNPFFAPRLRSVGGALSLDRLRDVPVLEKSELLDDQAHQPPYGDRLGVSVDRVAMRHQTAGTSGRGQEIYGLTLRDVEAAGYISSFAFEWAGLRPGEPAAFHIGVSNSSGGNAMLRGIQGVGTTPVVVAHAGFRERLDIMREVPLVGMYATPSAINGLAQLARAEGIDLQEVLPNLRFLLTSAEPYPLSWAKKMEDAYGARLLEDYGLTQSASAICACTCEQGAVLSGPEGLVRGKMHFFEWPFVFEFVDPDTLEPAAPGEDAEVLVTTLDKEASPVLRFRTRDRVRYLGTERCDCGRELATIEAGTISRFDDLMKIKGQNVWPADMESTALGMSEVVELSGEVRIGDKGRDELFLKIALADGADTEHTTAALKTAFKSRFNLTPLVDVVDLSSLPQWHTPEHKARRFTDLRRADLANGADGEEKS